MGDEQRATFRRGRRRHGTDVIPFGEALSTWARIAALSFGGPAGQIAVMHGIIVDEKRWVGEGRFLHALNFAMLLPGPEAHQLAIYLGWLLNGLKGGIAAGVLFVLPGFLAILGLSLAYVLMADAPLVAGLFFGLKAAIIAIVAQAVICVAKRALKSPQARAVAVAAFAALAFAATPFPLVIAAAALLGAAAAARGKRWFAGGGHGGAHDGLADGESRLGEALPAHARPPRAHWLRVVAVATLLWLGPVVALVLLQGPGDVFARLGVFFAQLAVVTFGGAYAVLAYVAQQAVEIQGWLNPGEMLDGLAMAETTPGPLIIVVQFVGFLAAMRQATGIDPLLAGILGSVLVTWITFVPSFLWIFAGAPWIERLRANSALAQALGAVTAAVVGVIASLALWLAVHSLFARYLKVGAFDAPELASANVPLVALTVAALVAAFGFRVGPGWLLAGCAAAGLALRLAGVAAG
jgi:chromate transporter